MSFTETRQLYPNLHFLPLSLLLHEIRMISFFPQGPLKIRSFWGRKERASFFSLRSIRRHCHRRKVEGTRQTFFSFVCYDMVLFSVIWSYCYGILRTVPILIPTFFKCRSLFWHFLLYLVPFKTYFVQIANTEKIPGNKFNFFEIKFPRK